MTTSSSWHPVAEECTDLFCLLFPQGLYIV